jgi:O-antigen ligase
MPVMHKAWLLLLPELRSFPPGEQACALARARATQFDVAELLGLAFSVAVVAAVTQYGVPGVAVLSRMDAALLNFGVALPLIAVCAAPLHLRRLRRGLREQLAAGPA